MLVVTWNMGCGPRSRYRRSHTDAWQFLLDLAPDIVLVQEALRGLVPPLERGRMFWSADLGTDSGTAIFLRSGLDAEPLALRAPGSYVAAASLRGSTPLLIASVHVGPGDYKENRRVLANKLIRAASDRRFIIGGDFNAARHWDTVYGGRTHTDFFKRLSDHGFHDCHWAQHGAEVQSFWGHQTRERYQCDHVFTDNQTAKLGQIRDCVVVDNADVRRLSDHGPLRLELLIEERTK